MATADPPAQVLGDRFMKSSSSLRGVPFSDKLREGFGLALMHVQARGQFDFSGLDSSMEEYDKILSRFQRPPLRESSVLEIGFGARPYRLVWLHNSGVQIWGVDLDKPLLRMSANSVREIKRQNGTERALKSIIRYCISDVHKWNQVAAEIGRRGRSFRIPEERLIVADASSPSFWARAGHFDFIYSEDVFEHIPRQGLNVLVEGMANALRPDGLALIRPMVFTGICGGHHLEWFPHTLEQQLSRRTEPWEHLRKNRFPANTYLNRLTRKEYVDIFDNHFEIVENETMRPDLGKRFLTSQIRTQLSAYSYDELFSNSVRFVLTPRKQRRSTE
jgi:SAM-dependent methyltransferase